MDAAQIGLVWVIVGLVVAEIYVTARPYQPEQRQ